MSIIWVHEALDSGGGRWEHQAGNRYVRTFDVLTDSFDDNELTVETAVDPNTGLGIPARFSYFEKGNDADYGAVAVRIVPERSKRYAKLWHVSVEYEWMRANTSSGQWPAGTIDVTARVPSVRVRGIPIKEVLYSDINGDAIANSASQPFNPRPEGVRYILAIEVTSWIRKYELAAWASYGDTTNAGAVWGFAPETVLMVGAPHAVRKVDQIGTYYELRAEFHWNSRGWKLQLEDRGTVRLVDAQGNTPTSGSAGQAVGSAPIHNEDGTRVERDVWLDGNGQKLPLGQPRVWMWYTVKEPKNWSALMLPELNVVWDQSLVVEPPVTPPAVEP